ncbi:TetR/AcrR family transcriptional regulator [Microlunatus soli]|uniref:DNA-binding transcriptional regulator, AcrR family n=1 Tax=Microlunatus soli TaxID=630515 RepID=A0A1H2A7P6_9ACTN|nr:TetR/AcrR family transcriptional regulator [Microlunatus soli]SDT41929.1 DNA-binding transcriptional regulator, AcrR family [Microlunatus soli]
MSSAPAPSARQSELLDAAYRYTLRHGLADLSLRPLATAIGSSPRVLMFLFGNKDGLVRALLARARADERELLERIDRLADRSAGIGPTAEAIWDWLADDDHRPLLRLWTEAYARSLIEPDGPWGGFAAETVTDWLDILAARQSEEHRHSTAGAAERSAVLAVLRGALLDLLATGDTSRSTAAVRHQLDRL